MDEALENFPLDARFLYQSGILYEIEAEFEEAQDVFEQALRISPNYRNSKIRLAELARRGNQNINAMQLLEEALAEGLDDANVAAEVGGIYLELGETNRAVAAFNRALEIDPAQPASRLNLIDYYLNSGQFERADYQLEAMYTAGIESPWVRYLRARSYLGMKQYDLGIEEMIALVADNLENADYRLLMGQLQFGADHYSVALENFQNAWELESDSHAAIFWIGRTQIALDNMQEAISALTTASSRVESGEYLFWLGYALEKSGQQTQALEDYSRSIGADTEWALANPDVFFRRGVLYERRGVPHAAYRDLRVTLTLVPNHWQAHAALGTLHSGNRNFEDAIVEFQSSLELEPDQPGVNYFCGLAYLHSVPPQYQQARVHLELAREANYATENPILYRQLGYTYRDLGENALAITQLQQYLDQGDVTRAESREIENEIRDLGGQPR